jgi:hypothetical protein
MGITLNQLLNDLGRTCGLLEQQLFGVQVDSARRQSSGAVVIDFFFDPPPELAAAGYCTERGRIAVTASGQVASFPLGSVGRRWKHRNGSPLGPIFDHLGGDLCLWYRHDPRGLRWEWDDGFEQYVTRVHRHLFFEEYWRRTGEWPFEDAPHGEPAAGVHPVLTRQMRKAAKQ